MRGNNKPKKKRPQYIQPHKTKIIEINQLHSLHLLKRAQVKATDIHKTQKKVVSDPHQKSGQKPNTSRCHCKHKGLLTIWLTPIPNFDVMHPLSIFCSVNNTEGLQNGWIIPPVNVMPKLDVRLPSCPVACKGGR